MAKFEENCTDAAMKKLFVPLIRMSYARKLQQQIDEKFHKYIPEDAKQWHDPELKYCKEDGGHPDALALMEKLNNKESPQLIKEFLETEEVKAKGAVVKEIVIEAIMVRTKKSLEHLKRFIEIYYTEVVQPLLLGEELAAGQAALIRTVIDMWRNNHNKGLQVIEKLH